MCSIFNSLPVLWCNYLLNFIENIDYFLVISWMVHVICSWVFCACETRNMVRLLAILWYSWMVHVICSCVSCACETRNMVWLLAILWCPWMVHVICSWVYCACETRNMVWPSAILWCSSSPEIGFPVCVRGWKCGVIVILPTCHLVCRPVIG